MKKKCKQQRRRKKKRCRWTLLKRLLWVHLKSILVLSDFHGNLFVTCYLLYCVHIKRWKLSLFKISIQEYSKKFSQRYICKMMTAVVAIHIIVWAISPKNSSVLLTKQKTLTKHYYNTLKLMMSSTDCKYIIQRSHNKMLAIWSLKVMKHNLLNNCKPLILQRVIINKWNNSYKMFKTWIYRSIMLLHTFLLMKMISLILA